MLHDVQLLLTRTSIVAIAALAVAVGPVDTARAQESKLAHQLRQSPAAVIRGFDGRPLALFGVPVHEARIVFLAVNQNRPLPGGFRPDDLDSSFGKPIRRIIATDLRAMVDAASAEDVDIVLVSGYRTPSEQEAAFESFTWIQLARAQGTIDYEEARTRAARFVAPPGHSQHQLGTAIDVSSWELNYALQPRFSETASGRWIVRHASEYGFVLPYTVQGEARTQYAHEPWHLRWVGRPLAAIMQADGYFEHPYLVADDYMRAVEEIMISEGIN